MPDSGTKSGIFVVASRSFVGVLPLLQTINISMKSGPISTISKASGPTILSRPASLWLEAWIVVSKTFDLTAFVQGHREVAKICAELSLLTMGGAVNHFRCHLHEMIANIVSIMWLARLFISIFGRGELSPDAVGSIFFFFGKFDFRHWSFRPLAFHRLASNAAKYWWADASFIYSLGASVNIYFGSWCRVLGEQPCGVCVEIVERDLVFVLDRERGMCMAPELHFGLNAQSKR